jgi:hypothetical protein
VSCDTKASLQRECASAQCTAALSIVTHARSTASLSLKGCLHCCTLGTPLWLPDAGVNGTDLRSSSSKTAAETLD